MAAKVRVALIGFGGMGKIYAQMIYAGMAKDLILIGVCCRNPEGQQLLKDRFPGVACYVDLDDNEMRYIRNKALDTVRKSHGFFSFEKALEEERALSEG